MDAALCNMFPRLTHSQMLRAYPTRLIEANGNARCFLLLDAFEIFAQQSSNLKVASTTYSDYKGHCTIKCLDAVDTIRCPHAKTVPYVGTSRHADGNMTHETQILKQVPFSHTCKTDKGFLIDNEAMAEGITINHPQKRLRH
jgi:hypothetical protein